MSARRYPLGDSGAMMSMAIKLRALATDLEAAAVGHSPDAETLKDAPVLDWWSFAARSAPCLVGERSGHPVLRGDGRMTITSDVYIVDLEAGVARTLSRWYRLGRERDAGGLVS
jgi:hypothetical protein